MENQIYTTKGWLPVDQVKLVKTVTRDDADMMIERIDKYLAANSEWVGNDLNIQVKRTQIEMGVEQGSIG